MKSYYLPLLLLFGISAVSAFGQQAGGKIDLGIQATASWADMYRSYDAELGMGHLNGQYFSASLRTDGFAYKAKTTVTILRYDSGMALEKTQVFDLLFNDKPASAIRFFTTAEKAYLLFRTNVENGNRSILAWEIDPITLTPVREPVELMSGAFSYAHSYHVKLSEDRKFFAITITYKGTRKQPSTVHVGCFDTNLKPRHRQEVLLEPDIRESRLRGLHFDSSGGVMMALFAIKANASNYKESKAVYLYFSEGTAPHIEYVHSSQGRYVRNASAFVDGDNLLMCTIYSEKSAPHNADWFTVVKRIPKPGETAGEPREILLPKDGGFKGMAGAEAIGLALLGGGNSYERQILHFGYWEGQGYLLVTEDTKISVTSQRTQYPGGPASPQQTIESTSRSTAALIAILLDDNLTTRWVGHLKENIALHFASGGYFVDMTPQHISFLFDMNKTLRIGSGVGVLRILPDGSYDTALVTEKEDASAQIVAASTVKLDTDKYLVRTQEGLTYGQRRIGILNIKSASLPALPFPK